MNERQDYRDRITIDPGIMAGKPTVEGTRIPVDLVLKRLSQDLNLETLFESYPRLTEEDVKACIAYAHAVLDQKEHGPASFSFAWRTGLFRSSSSGLFASSPATQTSSAISLS